MLSLEDKILGEKNHNYCSSSEDEDDNPISVTKPEDEPRRNPQQWSSSTANTGPKGVLNDWQQFKKLEAEQREDKEREKAALVRRLCSTAGGSSTSAVSDDKNDGDIDPELAELINDEFLQKYQQQKIAEMKQITSKLKMFGKVISLNTSDEFLSAIDEENPTTNVVVHVYDSRNTACKSMNKSFETLAEEYPTVKFCIVPCGSIQVSINFKLNALPALLVYKQGQVIGNFIRVSDELGNDFYPTDVESYLIEHGMLPDKSIT